MSAQKRPNVPAVGGTMATYDVDFADHIGAAINEALTACQRESGSIDRVVSVVAWPEPRARGATKFVVVLGVIDG